MKRHHGPWRNAGDDGDHARVLWRWRSKAQEEKAISYHIIHACDVYPFMHLILLRPRR